MGATRTPRENPWVEEVLSLQLPNWAGNNDQLPARLLGLLYELDTKASGEWWVQRPLFPDQSGD
jgi:hypothetical protein